MPPAASSRLISSTIAMTIALLVCAAACRGKASKAKPSAAAKASEATEHAEPTENPEHPDGESEPGEEKEPATEASPPTAAAADSLASAFLADLAFHHPDSEMFFAADVAALRPTPLWREGVEVWLGRHAPRTLSALRGCPGDPLAAITRASLTLRTPTPETFGTVVLRGAPAEPLLACLRAATAQLEADGLTTDELGAPGKSMTLRARTSDSTDVLNLRAGGERVLVANFGTTAAEGDDLDAAALRNAPIFVALVKAAPPRAALWFAIGGGANALTTLQQRGVSFAYLAGSLSTLEAPLGADLAAVPNTWRLDVQLHTATAEEANRYAKSAAAHVPKVDVAVRDNDVVVSAEGGDEQLRGFLARYAAAQLGP